MKTYIGWWLDSKTYTERANVPRSEIPELVDGAVQIRYDNVSKSKVKTEKIKMEKVTQVIEVDTRVNIKTNDRIRTDVDWLKVDMVELYIPKDKEAIVRMWPNRRTKLEVKRVFLV
jgi:hypothetical protein